MNAPTSSGVETIAPDAQAPLGLRNVVRSSGSAAGSPWRSRG